MKKYWKLFLKYWMKFAHILGTINGYLILTLIYFVVLGLYAIPYRLWMLLSKPKQVTSYWQKKEHTALDKESATYQF